MFFKTSVLIRGKRPSTTRAIERAKDIRGRVETHINRTLFDRLMAVPEHDTVVKTFRVYYINEHIYYLGAPQKRPHA